MVSIAQPAPEADVCRRTGRAAVLQSRCPDRTHTQAIKRQDEVGRSEKQRLKTGFSETSRTWFTKDLGLQN